jgi:hypothetical protein
MRRHRKEKPMPEDVLARLRTLDARSVAGIVVSHSVLLAVVLWGGLTYVVLQVLVVVEMVLLNIVSIAVLRRRRLGAHLRDIVRSTLGGIVLIGLILVGWTVMLDEAVATSDPVAGMASDLDPRGFAWAAGYVFAHLFVSAVLAVRSADPPATWIRETAASTAASMLALVAMVFVGFAAIFFVPDAWLRAGTAALGLAFSLLTVAMRFVFSLLTATFSSTEVAEIVDKVERN